MESCSNSAGKPPSTSPCRSKSDCPIWPSTGWTCPSWAPPATPSTRPATANGSKPSPVATTSACLEAPRGPRRTTFGLRLRKLASPFWFVLLTCWAVEAWRSCQTNNSSTAIFARPTWLPISRCWWTNTSGTPRKLTSMPPPTVKRCSWGPSWNIWRRPAFTQATPRALFRPRTSPRRCLNASLSKPEPLGWA